MPNKFLPDDSGLLIRIEGMINARERVNSINLSIENAQKIVNQLAKDNRQEHADYLNDQLLPNLRTAMEHLTEKMPNHGDLANKSALQKEIKTILKDFQQNLDHFNRFVADFDNDRSYSFKQAREQMTRDFADLGHFLKQAGINNNRKTILDHAIRSSDGERSK